MSIGLPVYNGAQYLASALDSLLAQDHGDLELVISDNASTDDTPTICEQYAGQDHRIRYHRNETNIGAAANFNGVFQHARGHYFMWAAHDDLWHPTYIRQCVEVLEQHSNVVLCHADTIFIDADGRPFPYDGYNRLHTWGLDLRRRVRVLSERVGWFALYGVMRAEVLRQTRGYQRVFGGDVILLMELLFHGDIYVIPESLFSYREIGKTSTTYMQSITGTASLARFTPYTGLARELLAAIRRASAGQLLKAQMSADLLWNVGFRNVEWRRLIAGEHSALAAPMRWVLRLARS